MMIVEFLPFGASPCQAASTWSVDDFASKLRTVGMLASNEWLVPVTAAEQPNQALLIRTAANPRTGWLRRDLCRRRLAHLL